MIADNRPTRLWRYLGYFAFGARVGLTNLIKNGWSLGTKKTLGKILQPVNAFSRYPEYDLFHSVLAPIIGVGRGTRILDIGSPKLFGLYLAYRYNVDLVVTDVNEDHLREYVQLWGCIVGKARGRVSFRRLDARATEYPNGHFDAVYAMSVIEHIDSSDGDRVALAEMWRVVRTGGTVVVSVPVGSRSISQYRRGFSYVADRARREERYFFQRIYERRAIHLMLRQALVAASAEGVFMFGIQRRACTLLKMYLTLGENMRAVLGGLFPLLACAYCRIVPGQELSRYSCERYGEEYRIDDVYADLVFGGSKATP